MKTHEAFSKATNEMVAFADSCLKGNCAARRAASTIT